MWKRADLKSYAKQLLSRSYGKVLAVSLIMSVVGNISFGRGGTSGGGSGKDADASQVIADLISGKGNPDIQKLIFGFLTAGLVIAIFGMIASVAVKLLLTNPIHVSGQRFFLMNRVDENAQIGEIGYAFKYSYKNIVLVMFFRDLFVWLWSLLLWIPGIIKAYEYRMIPYLLAENPNLTREDAFRISKEMMDGEKWNAFVLDLSFLGWYLLSLLTCGLLGFFYVVPYQNLTNAELYSVLKQKSTQPGVYQSYQNQNYQNNGY